MDYGFLRPEHEKFPAIVHVETTNVCNLKCIHCPQADLSKVPGYVPMHLEMDLWRKVADEVGENHGILRLTPDGEFLLHPEFMEQLRYAKRAGVPIFSGNTNGLLLDEAIAELLLEPGPTKFAIEFSIDALFPRTYARIRKGNYVRLMRNLFYLLNEKKRRSATHLKVLVSCVVQPELEPGEFDLFEKFWTPLADKVIRREYVDTKGLTPKKDTGLAPPADRWPCLVPFTRLVVSPDGRVRFCPDDWRRETVVGDIASESLAEIWQGKKMQAFRKNHLSRDFKAAHPTCAKCNDWKTIRWGFDYTKALEDLFGK